MSRAIDAFEWFVYGVAWLGFALAAGVLLLAGFAAIRYFRKRRRFRKYP